MAPQAKHMKRRARRGTQTSALVVMTKDAFEMMLARGLHYQQPKRNRPYIRARASPRSGHWPREAKGHRGKFSRG
ncbi:MAG: hypothetical protein V3R16_11125 [Nitrospirales bacterium]